MATMVKTEMIGLVPEWTLADRLRKARETAALKQTELATETGISRASIVNYESGKSIPRRPVLASWAMATGVPFEWLAHGEVEYLSPDGGAQEASRGSGHPANPTSRWTRLRLVSGVAEAAPKAA